MKDKDNPLSRFGVSIPQKLLAKFDGWTEKHGYQNRSHAIREVLREKINDCHSLQSSKKFIAVISYLYDHHNSSLHQKLLHIQHQSSLEIYSTLHIHLSHHQCLEILSIKGAGYKIQEFVNELRGCKKLQNININTIKS